jgi:hypothetical protein
MRYQNIENIGGYWSIRQISINGYKGKKVKIFM